MPFQQFRYIQDKAGDFAISKLESLVENAGLTAIRQFANHF